ncbi:DNA (cytosine-5-)-methyltransferase, partial [uncultured Maribacter sp.]|uniref:DNA (cytosine-5-)-methyltransferase n=1 Tax=uncultured Maribacter sp. TaxID=431308 RepID=UPI0030DDA8EE
MKVLSLFDGMSCGQIALDQLGIPVETYYASEIDKYAIQVTQANYPNTVQVGDVTNLDPKDFADVDLIMGGSPCQGFSFAGKQLAFDDPRSALFFEFIRLLKDIKPKYFLLENVRMKKEFLDIISQEVSKCYPEITFGISPLLINSSLVSAQSRQRYYWTNIPNIQQPKDRRIVLRDILENDAEEPMYSNIYGGFGEKKPRKHFNKSVTIRANSGGGSIPNIKLKDFELSDKAIDYMNRSSSKWSKGKTRKDIYIKHESEKGMCLT